MTSNPKSELFRKREKREREKDPTSFFIVPFQGQKNLVDGVAEYTFFIFVLVFIIITVREMAYNKGVHSSSGGSHRGRPYALILLITFGAALLGVMVLHKLRERRIYTLLVKEKDHQILALQLLLQVTNFSFLSFSLPSTPSTLSLSWFLFLTFACHSLVTTRKVPHAIKNIKASLRTQTLFLSMHLLTMKLLVNHVTCEF